MCKNKEDSLGKIVDVTAMEIMDSRGNPTVQATVTLDSGISAKAAVPSGASTGSREALELRDGGSRFGGRGVMNAVKNVMSEIAPGLKGAESREQALIDRLMTGLDGTDNKGRLGANAILGVSLAVCRASAAEAGMPLYRYIGGCNARELPVPMMNILNGGVHADNNLDIQEFMIMPAGFVSFSSALQAGAEIFYTLKTILKKNGFNTSVGDEGGFAPNLASNEDAVRLIIQAVSDSGYKPGKDVFLALDAASSEFYDDGKYNFEGMRISSADLASYYEDLAAKYPILSIEDGMAENDWDGWALLTERLGQKVQLVGDDLFVTNTRIFSEGINKGVANSILIKLNQIGTVTETLDAIEMAKRAAYTAVISHRSGETEDSFIADLAVACNTGLIKTGSASRSDRMAKYNRLIEIENTLAGSAIYKGFGSLYNLKK